MAIKIIKNVTVLTMNSQYDIIENGVVIIKDKIIEAIGGTELLNSYSEQDAVIINGNNGILMPGMINCHTHVSMVPFRSLADDVPNRLKRYLFPLEKMLVDAELVYIGAKYGIAEMLLGGVTTFADMYYFEDKVAAASAEMGMRSVLGETILNFPAPDAKEPFGGLEYSEGFIKQWKNHSLITPAVAPHAPYTNTTESLQQAKNLADKYQVPLLMHIAEMDYEQEKYLTEYNQTPIEYLKDIRFLGNNVVAAHVVNATQNDLNILQEYGVGISHNISANSKGAKGVAPVKQMYEMNLKLGLGTDGPMSSNTLDILAQMSLMPKIHKLFHKNRAYFPAKEVVTMGTIGGARALGIDQITGSIEVGKRADISILETESVNMQPVFDYYSVIVYSANSRNVNTVLVDGELLVHDKQLVKSDFKTIRRDLLRQTQKIKRVADTL